MRAFAGIGWICLTAIVSIAFQPKPGKKSLRLYDEAADSGGFRTHNDVRWNKTEHDFGMIKKGEIVETSFTCYNGRDTLRLENVVPSCGCMTPNWQKTPILPYDSTTIRLVFNTKNNSGQHTKYISVYSNKGLYELVIKANIEK